MGGGGWTLIGLPLWLKMPSISMLLLEWAMQRDPQGTSPSAAGDRSVVRTRHQSGLSCGLSRTSTVWPRRMVSSLLLHAVKSWITTVNSQPPDNCKGRKQTERFLALGIQGSLENGVYVTVLGKFLTDHLERKLGTRIIGILLCSFSLWVEIVYVQQDRSKYLTMKTWSCWNNNLLCDYFWCELNVVYFTMLRYNMGLKGFIHQ